MSVFTDAGLLIIGTRLKRLSDRFLNEVSRIYKSQDIRFEPAWFPVFFLLDKKGPLSLTEIASELEVSHSAVSQMITQLVTKKIVEIQQEVSDARVKRIVFSAKGKKLIEQVHPVWAAMQKSLVQMMPLDKTADNFLSTIAQLEEKLSGNILFESTLSYLDKNSPEINLVEPDDTLKKKLLAWIKNEKADYSLSTGNLLVAMHGKIIAGFTAYLEKESALFINHVYVSPYNRRKGIALNMLQHLYNMYKPVYFTIEEASLDLIKVLVKSGFSFKVK